jgi:hypothetical protein
MKKILICAALFFAPLTACCWNCISDEPLDYKSACLFYDAWNDEIVYDIPEQYMEDMYDFGYSVVITHWMPLEKPDNVFFDSRTNINFDWANVKSNHY